MEPLTVLALNCGSSSLKFGLYASTGSATRLLWEGEAEEIGSARGTLWLAQNNERTGQQLCFESHTAAFEHITRNMPCAPHAVGHRFVHGGLAVRDHSLVTNALVEQLRSAAAFAPLHVPTALAVLEAARQKMPAAPQAVCLDTAFHRSMPDVSRTFALPEDIRRLGVERFGFHGLSLESILTQLNPIPRRLIVAHLGNGCSVTAIQDGISVDTSMGLTPTGGVMMGTRCGDLDPGVMIYLLRNGSATAESLEELFDKKSGLAGVSGVSSDVRQLLSVRETNEKADLALRMFSYRIRKAIAAMAAALGGVDLVVFTGGIGEHAAKLRDEICVGLQFLGEFAIRILPAREDLQIASITARLARS